MTTEIIPTTIVFNYTPDDILKRERLGFVAEQIQEGYENIVKIYEIAKLTIKHPQAPNDAVVEIIVKDLYTEITNKDTHKQLGVSSLMFYLSQENLNNSIAKIL